MEENNAPINTEKKTEETTNPTDLEAHAADDKIAAANAAADRLEAANRETMRLQQKQENLNVNRALGGQTQVSEPGQKEETPEEYAKKVMANDL